MADRATHMHWRPVSCVRAEAPHEHGSGWLGWVAALALAVVLLLWWWAGSAGVPAYPRAVVSLEEDEDSGSSSDDDDGGGREYYTGPPPPPADKNRAAVAKPTAPAAAGLDPKAQLTAKGSEVINAVLAQRRRKAPIVTPYVPREAFEAKPKPKAKPKPAPTDVSVVKVATVH